MFPMPALRRQMAGVLALLLYASTAAPIAEQARAQSLAKPPDPSKTARPQDTEPPAVPAAIPAQPASPPTPRSASPPKPPAVRPEPKTIPKPGPGANDAGEAATGLRTVKLSLAGLIDRSVIGKDKGEIGHVVDVLVDAKGQPAALVVDVGGFMSVGNRRIAIAWERFALAGRKPKDALQLPLSDAQVKAAPAYDGSQKVTVIQNAVEPAAALPSRPDTKAGLNPNRVDLGEGLAPFPDQDQPADPLNSD